MTGRRCRAVVTMAHNEAVFLPIWWKYYARFFAPEDIYIIDHDTTDASPRGPASCVSRSRIRWWTGAGTATPCRPSSTG
jgi:hypothetical protein